MELIKWDEIQNAIVNAKDFDELSNLRDKIEAYRILARQSKQSLEVQNKIAEYRLRVDRKLGEWLDDNIEHGVKSHDATLQLKDIDINKSASSRLQKLSKIPEEKFEGYIQEIKEKKDLIKVHMTNVNYQLEFKQFKNEIRN